jgi:hypothetical protein
LYIATAGEAHWYSAGELLTTSGAGITANTWYHIAWSRTGTLVKCFINGVEKGSATISNNFTDTTFGVSTNVGSSGLVGYFDEVRVTKGVGRYTSNFAVPTTSFPDVADTTTYATWNPSDKNAGITLSNGDLTASFSANNQAVRATLGKSAGKWYWECYVQAGIFVGIGTDAASLSAHVGATATGWSYYGSGGGTTKYTNGILSVYGAAFTTGDTIGVALDMDAGTIVFYKNGVSQGTAFSGLTGTIFPMISFSSGSTTANFGRRPFTYVVPEGYNAGLYS